MFCLLRWGAGESAVRAVSTPTAMAWAGRASQSDDVKAHGHAGAKAGAPRGRSYPASALPSSW